jgi:hypothetical protein
LELSRIGEKPDQIVMENASRVKDLSLTTALECGYIRSISKTNPADRIAGVRKYSSTYAAVPASSVQTAIYDKVQEVLKPVPIGKTKAGVLHVAPKGAAKPKAEAGASASSSSTAARPDDTTSEGTINKRRRRNAAP